MVDYEVAAHAAVTQAKDLLEIFSALLRIVQVKDSSSRAGFHDVDFSTVTDGIAEANFSKALNG